MIYPNKHKRKWGYVEGYQFVEYCENLVIRVTQKAGYGVVCLELQDEEPETGRLLSSLASQPS